MARPSGPGESSGEFLRIYSDARPAALAGAYTALADNAAALQFNPAGLIRPDAQEITASYGQWFGGGAFQHVSYTHPIGGGLDAWGASILYFDPGSFMQTNELALETNRSLIAQDLAVTVGYARRIARYWAFGASGKYIYRRLDQYHAGALAADLGMLYWTPLEGLVAGVSIQNLGGTLQFISDRENLPLTFRGGLAYTPQLGYLTLIADLIQASDEEATVALGIEAKASENVRLRFGWQPKRDLYKGLGAGVGFSVSGIVLDYAYVPFEIFGGTHRVTGTVRFGAPTQPEVYRVGDSPFPAARASAPSSRPNAAPDPRPLPQVFGAEARPPQRGIDR